MSAAGAEVGIRMEIWRSFVGVLRSYAAVASPAANVHSVEDGTVADVVLHSGTAYLSFAFDAADGRGSYRTISGSQIETEERFRLHTEGTIAFDGVSDALREDLDHAAIRLIAALSSAAHRDRIEVLA